MQLILGLHLEQTCLDAYGLPLYIVSISQEGQLWRQGA